MFPREMDFFSSLSIPFPVNLLFSLSLSLSLSLRGHDGEILRGHTVQLTRALRETGTLPVHGERQKMGADGLAPGIIGLKTVTQL